ncbi:hypothetical protein H8A95_39270 [Bradyrhizobium sp. Pear76]|uniref:hypothetical protein n=1 Tax=Bradyrhizobium oropedii TaxID=1571201 RepID=UPI001E5D3429|nr:hypothetical protein [Bradyrhizobium oropedii]MCC8968189.1 hypothetical protein [Bradyrhizobium oropedii]
MSPRCAACDDSGWVCENHPDRPAFGDRACECGGAGAPCDKCNQVGERETPRLPKGFKTLVDKKGWRH